ncbi:MAG: GDP-mannose 4,6-dehydratase [Phycisphaerales bacterium]
MSTTDPTLSPQSTARRTLVTGGGGFIGSHLVESLLTNGDHVTIADNFSTGRDRNLAAVRSNPRLAVVAGDLAASIEGPLSSQRFDRVFHLAAAVGVQLVVEHPIECIETNVLQTAAVLRFASRCGPGGAPAPILIASSSEVYGKSDKTPYAEEDDVVYGPTTRSRWSYAATKAIDEYLALAHHAERGLPATVVRFFNTVGPRQVGDYGMVLPRFIERALNNQPLLVHGDGAQVRCFCDVRDSVPALQRLLETPACAGRVFNLGSDQEMSIIQLARKVIQTLGSASDIELVPYDRAFGAGFEDLRRRRPDLSRVREAIGFAPRIPLEQTIRDIAAHIQLHRSDQPGHGGPQRSAAR